MNLTFAQKLASMPSYEAGTGIDAAKELYGTEDVIKLASNESPYPPAEPVVEAIAAAAAGLNRYPDPAAVKLRTALADFYDLSPDQVAVGNGSCEILLAAADALLEPGSEFIYGWPSFSIYPHLVAMSGATERRVPLTESGLHDLDAIARQINKKTRVVVICNPNNPTATYIESGQIADFINSVPKHVCVILDEAYIEFQTKESPDNSLDLLHRFPNLVLLRTFSKVYGLSGLRCGYALGFDQFRRAVNQVRQPFSVNSLAQVAAAEALKHQDDVVRRVEHSTAERLWFDEEMARLALKQSASQANFAWVTVGEREVAIVEALARRGVLVRSGASLGAAGNIRVTCGTHRENQRFIATLEEVLTTTDR